LPFSWTRAAYFAPQPARASARAASTFSLRFATSSRCSWKARSSITLARAVPIGLSGTWAIDYCSSFTGGQPGIARVV
jgi:hypothetical protein